MFIDSMSRLPRVSKHSTIDSLTIEVVLHQKSVATSEMPVIQASDIGPYAEVRTRHALDIFSSAVGSHGFIIVFVKVLRKWLAVNNNVHNNVRDVQNDGHDVNG